MEEKINDFIKSNEKLFPSYNLSGKAINIVNCPPQWKAPAGNEDCKSPGFKFYKQPSKLIMRDYMQGVTVNPPKVVDSKLFSFDHELDPEIQKLSFQEKLDKAIPFASLYQNKAPQPISDSRIDVGKLSAGDVRNIAFEFSSIASSCAIVGPVIINCFLYDIELKRKVSETWRFLPPELKSQPGVNSHVPKYILDSPTTVQFPFEEKNGKPSVHIVLVVSLDRILIKEGGTSYDKYFSKANDFTKKTIISDIEKCNQAEVLQTFAWCLKPTSEFIPMADSKEAKIDNFMATQVVTDAMIAKEIEMGIGKTKAKKVPFTVTFKVHACLEQGPVLQHFYNFRNALQSETFQNKLFININRTKFKFPRSIRNARNILVNIKIVSNNKAFPAFYGHDEYISRVQYHEENPHFYDEAVAELPLDLPRDSEILFSFFHSSIKSGASSPLDVCGTARVPLFQNGAFITDGSHSQYIDYGTEPDKSEGNRIYFETQALTSLYSSDPQVQSIFDGNFKIKAPNHAALMPHLYTTLDTIIDNIQKENEEAFAALLLVLSSFDKERNSVSNHPLIFYIKYAALRGEADNFYQHLAKVWLEYINKNGIKLVRADINCCWFLLELVVKSLALTEGKHELGTIIEIVKRYSEKLKDYRNKQVSMGNALNITLVQFFKDVIEVSSKAAAFEMITNHLTNIELLVHRYDRECFRDILSNILTPKIFLLMLVEVEKTQKGASVTFFDLNFIPRISEAISVEQHTNMVFKTLYQVLSQYTTEQHDFIQQRFTSILNKISSNIEALQNYKNRTNHVYIFVICHYIFYYLMNKRTGISEKWTRIAEFMLKNAVHLRGEARNKVISEGEAPGNQLENLTKKMLVDVKEEAKVARISGARKFCSLRQTRSISVFKEKEEKHEITRVFDSLAFCTQSVFVKHFMFYDTVSSVNNIIAPYFDIEISPYLKESIMDFVGTFIEKRPLTFFCGKGTAMKHIIARIIKNPTPDNAKLLDRIGKAELATKIPNGFEYTTKAKLKEYETKSFTVNEDRRTKALLARALCKSKFTDETVKVFDNTMYADYITKYYEIDKDLTPEMKVDNPDVYADLLFKKLEHLEPSPDARIEVLLQLHEHQFATQYKSEALMAQLCSAAIVAEYLHHFNRIPEEFFNTDHPALKFEKACPPASMMVVPDDEIAKLPIMPGFCTSKYFTEFGLIYLIQVSMDSAKAADLYELSTRIHGLLNPIAQHRHLWRVLQKHYITGQLSWAIAAKLYTSSDRRLGSYYKVEFPDTGVFIYRETVLQNLWQVCAKLKKSSAYYSKGKEVVVVTEGQELDHTKYNDESKYYVHVKFVNQYFTPDEHQKRMTVFEQNHNINQFYFDVPFSKSAQSGLEHCYLKRTILTLPCPLPYLISRVHVPNENIKKIIFEPIEYAVQNLQSQVNKISESCARVRMELQAAKPGNDEEIQSFKELQPLIQGSLLVQVNEGPEKMAEVFLRGNENEHQAELREAFRNFIRANTEAVKLHGEMVMRFPVYTVLQEELELGLSKLTSKLQQYLK